MESNVITKTEIMKTDQKGRDERKDNYNYKLNINNSSLLIYSHMKSHSNRTLITQILKSPDIPQSNYPPLILSKPNLISHSHKSSLLNLRLSNRASTRNPDSECLSEIRTPSVPRPHFSRHHYEGSMIDKASRQNIDPNGSLNLDNVGSDSNKGIFNTYDAPGGVAEMPKEDGNEEKADEVLYEEKNLKPFHTIQRIKSNFKEKKNKYLKSVWRQLRTLDQYSLHNNANSNTFWRKLERSQVNVPKNKKFMKRFGPRGFPSSYTYLSRNKSFDLVKKFGIIERSPKTTKANQMLQKVKNGSSDFTDMVLSNEIYHYREDNSRNNTSSVPSLSKKNPRKIQPNESIASYKSIMKPKYITEGGSPIEEISSLPFLPILDQTNHSSTLQLSKNNFNPKICENVKTQDPTAQKQKEDINFMKAIYNDNTHFSQVINSRQFNKLEKLVQKYYGMEELKEEPYENKLPVHLRAQSQKKPKQYEHNKLFFADIYSNPKTIDTDEYRTMFQNIINKAKDPYFEKRFSDYKKKLTKTKKPTFQQRPKNEVLYMKLKPFVDNNSETNSVYQIQNNGFSSVKRLKSKAQLMIDKELNHLEERINTSTINLNIN